MKNKHPELLVIFILLFNVIVHFSAAQNNQFVFDHVSEGKDFLNSARMLYQDSYGYMWIGLNTALARYDGYEYKIFKQNINDSLSFTGGFITTIKEDLNGDLWIGTYNSGAYQFLRDTEQFIHYTHEKNNPSSLTHNEVHYIYPDSHGSVWIISNYLELYLDRIDLENGVIDRFKDRKISGDTLNPGNVLVDGRSFFDSTKKNRAALVEGTDGAIWYALKDGKGLCRYDYKTNSIKHYRHNENDLSSLRTDTVYSVIKDDHDNVWVGTSKGLHKYHSKDDNFEFFPDVSTSDSLIRKEIFRMFKDSRGMLWLFMANGVILFNPDNYECNLAYIDHGENSLNIIGEIPDKGIWIDRGVHIIHFYDYNVNKITKIQNIRLNNSIYDDGKPFSFESYLTDNSGMLWIAMREKGLYKENEYIRSIDYYSLESVASEDLVSEYNQTYMLLSEDTFGGIWFSTNNGLFYFNKTQNKFQDIPLKKKEKPNFRDNYFSEIVSDNQGKIWISTGQNGLITMDSRSFHEATVNLAKNAIIKSSTKESFDLGPEKAIDGLMSTRWSSAFADPQWLQIDLGQKMDLGRIVIHWEYSSAKNYTIEISDNGVSWQNIYTRKNRVQFGGKDDIQVDGRGRYIRIYGTERASPWCYSIFEIEIYKERPSFEVIRHKEGDVNGIPTDTIQSLLKDHKDNIWISTNKGLTTYDKEEHQFKTYAYQDTADHPFYNFYCDKNGFLWKTSYATEIVNFDSQKLTFNAYPMQENDSSKISNKVHYLSFVEDKESRLWALGEDADNGNSLVYLYHPERKVFEIKYSSIYPIREILHETDNTFWVVLYFIGMQLIDFDSGKVIKSYDHSTGLQNLDIQTIKKDKSGNVWLFYDNQICKYDIENESLKTYGKEYGLPDYLDYWDVFESKSGHFYIPGGGSFNVFHPDSLAINPYPPKVLITSLKIRGEEINALDETSILDKKISKTKELHLASTQNVFTIGFTGIHYGLPKQNSYAVFLEGLDEEWDYIGQKREVTYSGLSPGNYKLKVKASNPDGVWNETPVTLDIIVYPPWHKTWWAICIFILSAGGLLFAFYRWRTLAHKANLSKKQQEVDEQKKLNERLKQVDLLKDQFLANTSHELRTPLNGIIGLADSMKDGAAGKQPEKGVRILNTIISSGKRLSSLINDILDFSKLKNNELELQIRETDIHSAVDIVITLLRPLLKSNLVRVVNNIPNDIPLVLADENRVQQILNNLIGNAIKFTEEGTIIISAQVNEKFLEITVSDTGIGIPEDKHEKIFQSFEQIELSDVREYEGTGLGLAVTKQLVELHGGTIHVKSEIEKGSHFTFSLPLSEKSRSTQPSVNGKKNTDDLIATLELNELLNVEIADTVIDQIVNIPENEKAKINILIVDDEPVNLQVLENYLSMAGYKVTKANNGFEALEKIKGEVKFDLIILDIMMPKMSGYEVCNSIRELFLPSELPVVMLTAKNRVTDLVNGFNSGANDYLTKPFSKDELLSRVRTHLELHLINSVTNRFVPSKFLKSIGKDSVMDVNLGDHANVNVTVLFSDIRQYTSISETMTPEENFNFVHAYVKKMGPIIHENSGFVNQYMGDGIMAIFPEKTNQVLKAAIQMHHKIVEYNVERINKNRMPIKVGIGLHTGQLTMGIIGDEVRSDPSTISDSVNIASRIEQLTKHYGAKILLSESSFVNLSESHRYHIRYLGKVQVKGKKESVKVYECFDGDEKESIDLKIRTLTEFDIGLKQYYKKDFPEAAVTFKGILKINQDDTIVQHFYNMAAKYALEGVSEDWAGIEMMDSK